MKSQRQMDEELAETDRLPGAEVLMSLEWRISLRMLLEKAFSFVVILFLL